MATDLGPFQKELERIGRERMRRIVLDDAEFYSFRIAVEQVLTDAWRKAHA